MTKSRWISFPGTTKVSSDGRAGSVDKFAHPMDWERSVYDTIMFDQVVGIAQQFIRAIPTRSDRHRDHHPFDHVYERSMIEGIVASIRTSRHLRQRRVPQLCGQEWGRIS